MGGTRLLDEAARTPFAGWDFSWLGDRYTTEGPRWDLAAIVDDAIPQSTSVLDMGTGGGEWLAERLDAIRTRAGGAVHARRIVATEAWAPNVAVAAAELDRRGVSVVHDEGAAENVDQDDDANQDDGDGGDGGDGAERTAPSNGRLAFRDAAFDLVVNRHEAFAAAEVARVLSPGGTFATQQMDPGTEGFAALLGLDPPSHLVFDLARARRQVEAAGLRVTEAAEDHQVLRFDDVGALAWYLAAVPWAVPGFTIDDHRERLLALDGQPLVVRADCFWLRARLDTGDPT